MVRVAAAWTLFAVVRRTFQFHGLWTYLLTGNAPPRELLLPVLTEIPPLPDPPVPIDQQTAYSRRSGRL